MLFPFADGPSLIAIVILVVAVTFVMKAVKVVPQQNAWVMERLGRFHAVLQPGLGAIVPQLVGPKDQVDRAGVTRANGYLQAATWGGFTAGPLPNRGAGAACRNSASEIQVPRAWRCG